MSQVRERTLLVAGDALVHPLVVVSLLVWTGNDHVAKQAWPGVITGKVSDLAGLVVFPLLLVAVAETIQRIRGATLPVSARAVGACIVATALVFGAIKVWPSANLMAGAVGGALQTVIGGHGRPVVFARDPTDLLMLPALGAAWAVARARLLRSRRDRG